jgi:hypothetical protein
MFKKNLAFLLVLFSAVSIFNLAARAQETESAASSSLTGITLPSGAQRILPGSMPASITEGFDKVVPADGSLKKGELEALVWMGGDYQMANAPQMVSSLTGALKAAGWQYSVESDNNGVCVFSLVKEGAARRAIVGYYGATKEALVLAWMELLPANGNRSPATNDYTSSPVEPLPLKNSGGGSVVGTWSDGSMSLLIGYTPTYGPKSYTPGRSHVFKYIFHSNGTFEFTGLMQLTQYSCTSSYFQDKRGRYTISGDQIKLTLTKNFWRKQNSCAPSSDSEVNHKLDPETYTFSVKRSDRGKEQVCLNSGEGDACYERQTE